MENGEMKNERPTVKECPNSEVITAQTYYEKVDLMNGKIKCNLYAEVEFH